MNIYPQFGSDPKVVLELDLHEARELDLEYLGWSPADAAELDQAITDLEKGAPTFE